MKVESESLSDHQTKLTVTLSQDQLDSAKQQAARRISRNTKIPGFRPGKAPYPVVARTVGDAVVVEEALEILVDRVYPEALEEAGIEPYGPGALENVKSMDPPVFEFVVPLAPEVELGDYTEIHIPYAPPEPSGSEIKKVLDELRESQAVVEHVERPAEAGDIVYLTLSGDEARDDGSEAGPLIPERKINILIHTEEEGSPADEWPFPGFNQDLIMASAGDVRDIEYDYPDDEEAGTFRGKTVNFQALVDEVVSREMPPLDDEFAQSVGEFETADELKDFVANSIQESSLREYDDEYNQKILDQLVEISTIDYPPQMTDHELEHMVARFEQQIAGMGMDLDVYLKTRDMSREDLEEEMKPEAEVRILRSLALLEFISKEDFEIDQDEVKEELDSTMELLAQSTAGQPARSRPDITRDQMENQIVNRHIERSAFNKLKAIASGEPEDEPAPDEDTEPEGEAPEEGLLKAKHPESSLDEEAQLEAVAEPAPKKAKKKTKKTTSKKKTKQAAQVTPQDTADE